MNGRYRGVVVLLVLGILGAAVAAERSRDRSAETFPRVEFGETTSALGKMTLADKVISPNAPSQIMVYKVQPLESKKAAVLDILKSLPLDAGPKADDALRQLKSVPTSSAEKESSFGASIGGWEVEVWNGGQFSIRREIDYSKRPAVLPAAPSSEECRKVADAFLAKIPLPVSVRFSNASPGETVFRGAGNKPGDVVVEQMSVSYASELDGVPYGSVSVFVAAGPKVMSVTSHIRRAVPYKMAPILSPKEAFARLQAGEGELMGGKTDTMEGKVTSIKLAYHQEPLALDQDYILPIYVFQGESVLRRGNAKPRVAQWTAAVEAIRPESLEAKPEDDLKSKSVTH